MFKVTVNGTMYKAFFRYENSKVSTCTIVVDDPLQRALDPKAPEKVVCRGVASLFPGDHFNKYEGRKRALKRALSFFTRDTRTIFWSEYWKVSKKPR